MLRAAAAASRRLRASLHPARPGRAAGGAISSRDAWRYLASYYRAGWPALATYVVIAALNSLAFLPTLYLVRRAFDVAIPRGDTGGLLLIGAGLLAARLLASAVALAMRTWVVRLIKGAVSAMRRDLLRALYGLSRQYFAAADTHQLHVRIVQDTERADTMSNALLSGLLPAALAGLSLLGVLAWLNWRLTLLALLVAPLVLACSRATAKLVKRRVTEFQQAFEAFSMGVLFVLRQMDLTRTKAFEQEELRRQGLTLDRLRRTGQAMAKSYALHGHVHANLVGLAGLGVLVFGGIAIARGALSLGDFVAFYIAAGLLNGYAETATNTVPELISGTAALKTLLAIRDARPLDPYSGTAPVAFRGHLRLRGVSFAYGERTVLRNVSLDIKPGANIAVAGPNGAGKTTVLALILGFLRPSSGWVEAEGIPYAELDLGALRRRVGVVMQHPTFFAGTIMENIGYGQPGLDGDALAEAARRAGADAFIRALPDGYATAITNDGAPLSGGELQRLAIARALAGEPRLLILDEPTNHLDAHSVGALMRTLAGDPGRPAMLIITHDPAVLQFADTVLRLENGGLTAQTEEVAARASLA